MATVLVKSAVKREKGKLYFVDGKGNVCSATMNRKGGKKGRKVCGTHKAKPAKKSKAAKRKPAKKATKRKTTKKRVTRRKTTKRGK